MSDYRTTAGEAPPLPRQARRRRFLLWAVGTVVVLGGLTAAGYYVQVDRYFLASGYVTTEEYAEVRPTTTGTVSEILAHSGDRVESGQLVVRLDASEEQASLDEAQSQVRQTEAELTRRQAEIAEIRRRLQEDMATAQLRLRNASGKLARTNELVSRGLVAGSALEDDKLREELARAELASLTNRDLSVYDKEIAVLERQLEGRREAVSRTEARMRAKEVRAPIAGLVLRYEFVVGELVRPETVLLEVFGGDKQVLKVRIPERYATKTAAGQRYAAKLAPFRGVRSVWFEGTVESLRSVIQSEAQKTYRVAYCDFAANGYVVPPGTTAEARIYYGRSCLWLFLFGVDW